MNSIHRTGDMRLSEISQAVQVRHIATPLERATMFDADSSAREAANEMERRDYDSAPVHESGKIVGIVDRLPLIYGDTVSAHMRSLWPGLLVTADTPLASLLEYLLDEPLLLVMDHREVTGLITPSDLNKPAARSHFYLQIAALEIALAAYLRQVHPDPAAQESAVAILPRNRRAAYERNKDILKRKNQFLGTFSSISLDDLIMIAGKQDDFCAASEQIYGAEFDGNLAGTLTDPRNNLMHPTRPLGEVRSLIETRDRVEALTEAAEQCLRLLS